MYASLKQRRRNTVIINNIEDLISSTLYTYMVELIYILSTYKYSHLYITILIYAGILLFTVPTDLKYLCNLGIHKFYQN